MKHSMNLNVRRVSLPAAFLGVLALGGALGVACSVSFPEDARYVCGTNDDCGGNGLVCAPAGFCCQPSPELCDGVDTDCDGVLDNEPTDLASCYTDDAATRGVGRCKDGQEVCENGAKVCEGQVRPGAEQCNGVDDDCDGTVDDGFNFQSDPNNCGQCRAQCVVERSCVNGQCPLVAEVNCGDGIDDDQDGNTDCLDGDCINESCGAGCQCTNYVRKETACDDGQNNDEDMSGADCADSDCNNRFCEANTEKRCQSGSCS